MKVDIKEAGQYLFYACYNDFSTNDPTSCSNCAIRSVFVDGKDVGALVFPVVNYDFQTSTHLLLQLSEGSHEIVVKYDKANHYDSNMSQDKHTYGSEQYRPDNNVQYDYFVLDKADNICVGSDTYLVGDADANDIVDVMDATLIQKWSNQEKVTIDELAADADTDGYVNVMDATAIQRYAALYNDDNYIGQLKAK